MNFALPIIALTLLLALAAPGAGCGREQGAAGDAPAPPAPVTALVAASTADAVQELAGRFQKQTGAVVTLSPGPSNQLAAQILQGAPADVFLSANATWAEEVKAKGLASESRDLLGNGLVIVVPSGNPAGVRGPADLASERVKKVALAGENVPAGTYAGQALKASNLYPRLAEADKVARGHDVRAALTYVERGEAEAGVVYSTDAAASKGVETVYTFDPAAHEKVVYPLVLLKGAEGSEAARKFYEYLGSAEAEGVFRKHGFVVLK